MGTQGGTNCTLAKFLALCLDTHLSRFPCSGQWCRASNPGRILFSGKKGSLGIPLKVAQQIRVIHTDILITPV